MTRVFCYLILAVIGLVGFAAAGPAPQLTEAERAKAESIPAAANFAAARWGSSAARAAGNADQALPQLIDGKADTRAEVPVGVPVIIRFDTALLVCRSRLLFPPGFSGRLGYKIEVSENRQDWRTVVDFSDVAAASTQTDTFRPVPARALRVTMTRYASAEAVPLAEVEFYGLRGNLRKYGAW